MKSWEPISSGGKCGNKFDFPISILGKWYKDCEESKIPAANTKSSIDLFEQNTTTPRRP